MGRWFWACVLHNLPSILVRRQEWKLVLLYRRKRLSFLQVSVSSFTMCTDSVVEQRLCAWRRRSHIPQGNGPPTLDLPRAFPFGISSRPQRFSFSVHSFDFFRYSCVQVQTNFLRFGVEGFLSKLPSILHMPGETYRSLFVNALRTKVFLSSVHGVL